MSSFIIDALIALANDDVPQPRQLSKAAGELEPILRALEEIPFDQRSPNRMVALPEQRITEYRTAMEELRLEVCALEARNYRIPADYRKRINLILPN